MSDHQTVKAGGVGPSHFAEHSQARVSAILPGVHDQPGGDVAAINACIDGNSRFDKDALLARDGCFIVTCV